MVRRKKGITRSLLNDGWRIQIGMSKMVVMHKIMSRVYDGMDVRQELASLAKLRRPAVFRLVTVRPKRGLV